MSRGFRQDRRFGQAFPSATTLAAVAVCDRSFALTLRFGCAGQQRRKISVPKTLPAQAEALNREKVKVVNGLRIFLLRTAWSNGLRLNVSIAAGVDFRDWPVVLCASGGDRCSDGQKQ